MPHTLYIGNDITTAEPVQIFCKADFVRMIDERLGRDASGYVNMIIDERNDAIRERDEAIRDGGYDGGYQDGFDAGLAAGEESYE